jgi:hypothetical protein
MDVRDNELRIMLGSRNVKVTNDDDFVNARGRRQRLGKPSSVNKPRARVGDGGNCCRLLPRDRYLRREHRFC